ncbi:hypothetical protein BIW11_03427 [Tropilaelaps mercedesae]|uniref:Uncharacterized protein n=1 Tax=Tropilaelaps mercedesae TaxID=418985 RepID=A0A1V9XM04_9ACAR|nr:hypothetical protein BIW11_03427 [Tropilaelaps mercedesae]
MSRFWISFSGLGGCALWSKSASSLRRLAVEAGGLLEDELRKEAWPILLELDDFPGALHKKPTKQELEASPFYDQSDSRNRLVDQWVIRPIRIATVSLWRAERF